MKTFRDRIGEVSLGGEVVVPPHRGKRVGRYVPERASATIDHAELEALVEKVEAVSRRRRSDTPDWRERLESIGFDKNEIAELEC